MTARLVVLASGSGSNLQAIIDATLGGRLDAQVSAVVVNRAGAYAAIRAEAHAISATTHLLKPYLDDGRGRERYDIDLAALVAGYGPDWVVMAGWMHLLSAQFLDRFANRVVNLHPALPGCFPGAHAIDDAWAAFEAGQITSTGVMVHLVPDEGVDDGPVLGTTEIEILPTDTRESLEQRIHEVEHELFVDVLQDLVSGRLGHG